MSSIIGGGSNAKQTRAIGSLQFQTAQAGGVIPLAYGTCKVSPNLIITDDFTAMPATAAGAKGKGGALGKGSGNLTYSASFVMGICQGPIVGFGMAWWNKSIAPVAGVNNLSSLNLGADGQAADPTWLSRHPNETLNYSGTANASLIDYPLGPSAALPNFNFEVYGIESGSGVNGYDANPAAIVTDFLTNPRYGANFPAANLDPGMTSGAGSYQAYCNAVGLWLSPNLDTQQAAQQSLSDMTSVTNSAIVWSGALLKIIPYGDQPISTIYTKLQISGNYVSGDTFSLTFAAAGLSGSPVTVSYQAQPENADTVDLASLASGLTASAVGNGALTGFGIYCGVTPTGVLIAVRSTAAVTISAATSGGATMTLTALGTFSFTPVTQPVYTLGEDDFVVQETMVGVYLGVTPGGAALRMGATPITGGFTDDPVHIVRSTPADANNWVELECVDRGNGYNTLPVIAFDQGSIDLYGVRKQSSLKARAITDSYFTGPTIAQLVLQRGLLYRNTYSFQLGWKYCLLEPMDLVQISDVRLGAAAITVRITAVQEDEEGLLSITAEDFFGTPSLPVLYPPALPPAAIIGISSLGVGGGTATVYLRQGLIPPTVPVFNRAAPAVNTPFLMEAPAALLAAQGLSSPTLIVGLSGGPGGAFDPNWGGAQVYASLDDISFGLQGSHSGPSTMGVSTADLPAFAGSNPDTAHTLSVNLAESAGVLNSVAAGTAAALVTLCAVQNAGGTLELIAFETATLTGANAYNLTTLYRGLYGTSAVDHPSGAQFLFLAAGNYYSQTLPTQFVGQNLWFKFPSFNVTDDGLQALASATAYEYLVSGSGTNPLDNPIIAALAGGASQDWGHVTDATTASADFGHITDPVALTIDLGHIA